MIELLQTVVTVLVFFVMLGTLVVIHELGHFVTARLAGVRVLEFGIGFPPRAKVIRSSGETLYTLNWLPIGGFVKLEGEDGDDSGDPRSFVNARLPVKLLILVAGVAMNVVLAFAIFTAIAWVATPFFGVRFDAVQPGSPAEEAGLRSGDAIVGVDGRRFEFFGGRTPLDDLRERAGETVDLEIVRADGSREAVVVTLRPPEEITPQRGALGISGFESYFPGEYTGHDLPTAVGIGAGETTRALGLILNGLGDLVGSVARDPTAAPPAAGPVGIATQIGEVLWTAGPVLTLYMAAILSANLALVNILPFPPLDGGRIVVILLKSVFGLFGRRVNAQLERATYLVGFLFLFAFLIWITGFDIARQLGVST